jgi:hypothetical protein
MLDMVTHGYSLDWRTRFILDNLPILQLAFVEYIYNFMPDFMPVEMSALHIADYTTIPHNYSSTCDQFRERCIKTGSETWQSISFAANIQVYIYIHTYLSSCCMNTSFFVADG